MSTTAFPIDGTLVCVNGIWDRNVPDGGHTAVRDQSCLGELAVYFRGSTLALAAKFGVGTLVARVDGGSAIPVTDPNSGGWGPLPIVSGLSDGWHLAVIVAPDDNSAFLMVDQASGVVVTGSAPAVATPPGYAPAYPVSDPAASANFVPFDPATTSTFANTVGNFSRTPAECGWTWNGCIGSSNRLGTDGTRVCDGVGGGGFRFRAGTASVAVFGYLNGAVYTLYRNNVAVATVTGSGAAAGVVVLATGLDATVADYAVVPDTSGGDRGAYLNTWVYSVLLTSPPVAAPARTRLLGLGDSMTSNRTASHAGFLVKLAMLLGMDPVTRAVSGRTLDDYTGVNGNNVTALETTLALVNQASTTASVPGPVAAIAVLIGANDIDNATGMTPVRDPGAAQAPMVTVLTAVAAAHPEATMLVMGPLDVGVPFQNAGVTTQAQYTARTLAFRAAYAAAVAQVAKPRVRYLDTANWITVATDTVDQLHLTPAGNDKVAARLVAAYAAVATGPTSPPRATVAGPLVQGAAATIVLTGLSSGMAITATSSVAGDVVPSVTVPAGSTDASVTWTPTASGTLTFGCSTATPPPPVTYAVYGVSLPFSVRV